MGNYSTGGRCHRILERLAKGPASRGELARLIQGSNQTFKSAKHRAWSFVVALETDGLAARNDGLVDITPAGRRWLDERGPADDARPARTSVRIFVREAMA